MSRVDDVTAHFLMIRGCANLNEDSKKLLADAVRYGFEHGVSFGKYEAYCAKVQKEIVEEVNQPVKNRDWEKKINDVLRSEDITNPEWKQVYLLKLIAEIILCMKGDCLI